MGFGILFIGYFFLINITYFTLTDMVAGVLMLMALSSLSRFNKPLKLALYIDGVFVLIALGEFLLEASAMFSFVNTGEWMDVFIPLRHITLAALNISLLLGIRSLALEVGLEKLANKCTMTLSLPTLAYLLSALLEVSPLFRNTPVELTQYVALIALLLTIIAVISVLARIYGAYARICMPEDIEMDIKPSRFAFVNRFREKQAQRDLETQEEMARLRQERQKKRLEKQKRKKKQ